MYHEKISINSEQLLTEAEQIMDKHHKPVQFDPHDCYIFSSKKHYVLSTKFLTSPLELNQLFPNTPFSSDGFILKIFNTRIQNYLHRWEQEIQNYDLLLKLNKFFPQFAFNIPKRLFSVPGLVAYEQIKGQTVEDLLITLEINKIHIQKLAKALCILHVCGYSYGDQRFRNFIYSGTKIYCIDYEDITSNSNLSVCEDFISILSVFLDSRSLIFEQDIDKIELIPKWNDWVDFMICFYIYYGQSLHNYIQSKLEIQENNIEDISINFQQFNNFLPNAENWLDPKNWGYIVEKIINSLFQTAQRRGFEFIISRQQKIRELLLNRFLSTNLSIY